MSDKPSNSTDLEDVRSIVANDTAFYALTRSGHVYSWGDARHGASLGRDVTEKSLAEIPSVIEDLSTDPIAGITKISAGGYTAGALTTDNDLYVWGGRQGQETPLPAGLSQVPEAVDVEGEDILDFGVGDRHIIVLTMSHRLFVIGNYKGQKGDDILVKAWKEIELPLEEGQKAIRVYAGYRNSFAVVE